MTPRYTLAALAIATATWLSCRHWEIAKRIGQCILIVLGIIAAIVFIEFWVITNHWNFWRYLGI